MGSDPKFLNADEAFGFGDEARFRIAFEYAPIGLAITGIRGEHAGAIVHANPALARLLGREPGELDGTDLRSITHPLDRDEAVETAHRVPGEVVEAERRYLHSDGSTVWTAVSSTAVPGEDGGPPVFAVTQVVDISERRRFEAQLRYLADHDPLTGLYNRTRFEVELERTVTRAQQDGRSGALMVIDLDGFKFVNDRFGHAIGDELVAQIAGLLRQSVRDTDFLARIGGDEFAIIVNECDVAEASAIAEKLIDAVRARSMVVTGLATASVTTSLGLAMFGAGYSASGSEVAVAAEIAMYDAKADGRNRYVVFKRGGRQAAEVARRDSWFSRLRRALDEDRFILYAQPIVPINGGGLPRYELLLRMLDDAGELVAPGAFLFNAERFELIGEIDRWVLRRAARILHEHEEAVNDFSLSVNHSGRTMNDLSLAGDLAEILTEYPIKPGRLVVEVTETAAIVNIERARELAGQLRQLGCLFALDDFGAGFASFYYLKHLQFDYLKIDGEFVTKLVSTEIDQLVVKAVVGIARGLGTQTVAEFVGDPETVELLRSFGVDYGQGHHLGSPRPVHEVLPPL